VVNDNVAVYINFFANTQRGHNTLLHSFSAPVATAHDSAHHGEEGVPQTSSTSPSPNPASIPGPSVPKPGPAQGGGMCSSCPPALRLARNAYVDERFDPEKSTRAYAAT